MDSRLPLALACCLAVSALAPMRSEATTYYVRTSGNDAANGLTPATAFATIRRAADSILNPGDRVVVGPGTYAEGDLRPANNGIVNRPVVFFADTSGAETTDAPGAVVIAPGSTAMTGFVLLGKRGVTIDGFQIRGASDSCLQVRPSADGAIASRDIVIRNVRATGCAKRGIDIVAAGSVTVEDCHASGNITGISITGHGGVGSSAALGRPELDVHDNEVVTNSGEGIYLERVSGTVRNNAAFDNGFAGIQLRTSDGVSLVENDVRRNGAGGIVVGRRLSENAVGDVVVEGNRIEDNFGPALEVNASGESLAANNTVPAAMASAIVVRGIGTGTATIRDNRLPAAALDAIFVENVADALIERNDIGNSGENGIQVRASVSATIRDNDVVQTGSNGIDVEGDGLVTIENNAVVTTGVESTSPAIAIESALGSAMVTVVGNDISVASSHGVSVAGAVAGSVSSNRIESVGGQGILVENSTGISIRDNDVGGVAFSAIRARGSADLDASGNVVVNPADGGINLEADGVVVLRGNQVSGCGDSGLAIVSATLGSSALVADNMVSDSVVHGVFASGAGSVTVIGNRISGSGQTGVNVLGASSSEIADNEVRFSVQEAVRITGRGPAAVVRNRIEDNLGSAILLEADAGSAFELAIEDNELLRQVHGIFVRGCAGGSVERNGISSSSFDGILLRNCSGVSVVDNDILDSGGNGILVNSPQERIGRDFSLRRNRVVASGANAIAVYARGTVVATGNEVDATGSRASGLSVIADGRARIALSDNVVRRAASHGIFVQGGDRGLVQNSVVHTSVDTGVTCRSCADMLVANNLIYANGTDGLAIGTGGGASPRATVTNNTIYANGARGFVLGSGGVASPGARFFNNIIESNRGIGLAVDRLSAEGFIAGFNVNSDGYGEDTPVSAFDVLGPAGFIAPAGADGTLGGTAAADDDFRLQQVRGGQATDAIAVDAGSADAAAVGLTGTTAVNGVADIDRIDAGFHYDALLVQSVQLPPAYMPLYVNADGDDGNDGRTRDTSLRSIRRAGILAASGATVIVAPGRYVEPEPIRVRQGAAAVTFLADASGERSLRPAGPVVIDADGGDNAFVLLDADDVTIDGFHVTNSATAAIQVRDGADRATVRNNVVFSNAKRGIEIRSADAGLLTNNLVYANGTGGIQLQATRGSEVSGNTVYGNGENGITVGGSAVTVGRLDRAHGAGESVLDIRLASVDASKRLEAGDMLEIGSSGLRYRVTADANSVFGLLSVTVEPALVATQSRDTLVVDQTLAALDTSVVRNVVAANNLGILAQANSLGGYECGANVVADGLPGLTPRCDSDILAAPQFVDPQGADGILGGTGFADDDFRLWQDLSPAVDLTLCTDELSPPAGTTDPAGFPDECPIDSGYHYPEFALAAIE